jgi:CheY-like chemotaxis protein
MSHDRAERPSVVRGTEMVPTDPSGFVTARILVVDDYRDGADMLAEALSGRGYDTRVAHDALTALRVAAEFLPDCAVLDIGLPVMDGYELASQLREIRGLASLQLVALTGYGQESDRRRALGAGFHHYLVKPVNIDDIEGLLVQRSSRSPD